MKTEITNADREANVGQKEITLNIGAHVSPGLRAILPPSADVAALAAEVHQKISYVVHAALAAAGATHMEWTHDDERVEVTHKEWTIVTHAQRKADMAENMEALRRIFADGDAAKKKKWAEDPKNGTDGLWHVGGIRHETTVRATSAVEAHDKAIESGDVGDWEVIDVTFVEPIAPAAAPSRPADRPPGG